MIKEAVMGWIRELTHCIKALEAVKNLNENVEAIIDFSTVCLFAEFKQVRAIHIATYEALETIAEALELPIENNEGVYGDCTYYHIEVDVDGEEWYLFDVELKE